MEPRVNVITLAVDDLERALAFYRDGLGLSTSGLVATDLVDDKTGAAGAIVIFKLESGLILSLYPRSELGKDAAVASGPPKAPSSASANWSRAEPKSTASSNRRLPPARR